MYRIAWHNDFFCDDEAWLRGRLATSGGEELDHFWEIVLAFPRGQALDAQWQRQVAKAADARADEQRAANQPHPMLAACEDYMALVDEQWDKIADWYHLPRNAQISVRGVELNDPILRASSSSNDSNGTLPRRQD